MPERERRGSLGKASALGGIALGLAFALVILRFAPKPRVPGVDTTVQPIAGSILPEDEGPLSEILVQYAPNLAPLVTDTYTDFLRALDPATRVVAVVPRGATPELRTAFDAIDAALMGRTRVIEVDGPITVWSKDRALVLAPFATQARTTFVIPVPPDPKWVERTRDWATLAAVASAAPERYAVREIPLDFDAGDFAVVRDRVLFDVNLVEKNKGRGLDADALTLLVKRLFGRDAAMLGRAFGDVPRHHMSMYMTPLGRDAAGKSIALVGDPRAALAIIGPHFTPGRESPDTGEPLEADFSDESIARFDRAAKDLSDLGFAVERVPVVPFDDKTYITYTNGVYEARAASGAASGASGAGASATRIVYLPQYGISRLDDAAREKYAALGWSVKPVRVALPWPYHGTIGCLTNVLRR